MLEQLYSLINARYEEERAVIITTNLERDDLATQINERTVSRLEEMCEILPVGGEDLRKQSHRVPEPVVPLAHELSAIGDDDPSLRWNL